MNSKRPPWRQPWRRKWLTRTPMQQKRLKQTGALCLKLGCHWVDHIGVGWKSRNARDVQIAARQHAASNGGHVVQVTIWNITRYKTREGDEQ